MAQDQKTISAPLSGMIRDLHPGQLEDRQYTFALNANAEADDGNMGMRSGEPANMKCLDLEGWKVCGYKNDILSGNLYLFLSNEQEGTSKISFFKPTWEVAGLSDEEILSAVHGDSEICAGLQTLIEDDASDPCLKFSVYHPIKTVEIKTEKCGRCIYWTDGINPPRYVIIEKALEPDEDGDIWYHYHGYKICGEKKEDGTLLTRDEFIEKNGCFLACEKLRVFPLMEQPCIEPESIAYGGSLRAGVYQFSVALCDEFGNELTNYGPLTNPVMIFDEHDITIKDGMWGARTNLGVRLLVTNIDRQAEYFKVVVVQNTVGYNGESQPANDYFVEGIHPVTEKTIYYYSDLNNKRTTFEHISYKRPVYNTSEGIATVDNRLLQYGLTAEKEWNLQPIVSLMGHFLKWQSSVSTGDLYKDGNACSLYVGYMRDEVYPFGISFRTKTGYTTPIFTFIPHPSEYARTMASEDNNLSKPVESIESNVSNCYDNPRQYVWQFRNTCSGGTENESSSNLRFKESVADGSDYTCKNETVIKQTFVESGIVPKVFRNIEMSVFDETITDVARYLSDNILDIACSNTLNQGMNEICQFLSEYMSYEGDQELQGAMDGINPPDVPTECSNTRREEAIIEVPYELIENPKIETTYLTFDEMTYLNDSDINAMSGEDSGRKSYIFGSDAQDEFNAYIERVFYPTDGNEYVSYDDFSEEQREALTPSVYINAISNSLLLYESYESGCGSSFVNACENPYSVNGLFQQYQTTMRFVCSYIRPDDFWNLGSRHQSAYDEYASRTFPGIKDQLVSKMENVTWLFNDNFDTGVETDWVTEITQNDRFTSTDRDTEVNKLVNNYGMKGVRIWSGYKMTKFYSKMHRNSLWFRISKPESWNSPDYEGNKVVYFEAFGKYGDANTDLGSSEYVRISFWKDSNGTPLNTDIFEMGSKAEYKSGNSYIVRVSDHFFNEITESEFNTLGVSEFYMTLESPYVASCWWHSVRWGNNSYERYAMVGGCMNAGKTVYPYVIAMRDKEVSGFSLKADSLRLKANVTFVSDCTSCGDKPINCAPRPYRYGDFGYYESSHLYPANYELWDSTRVKMDLSRTYEDEAMQEAKSEVDSKMREWYGDPVTEDGLSNFSGGTFGGNQTSLVFCQKPIRHYRFPDNFHSHFMNSDMRTVSENSEIYPVGVMINESIINVFLDYAVDSGFITKEQRESVVSYELYRGDRRLNKSVLGCGLGFDMLRYEDNDGTVNLYPNYPYNDLSDDQYHYVSGARTEFIHHPFNKDGNVWYSLISPDFYFNKPEMPEEVSIDGYMRGMSTGCFTNVENHPKWTILSDEGYRMAKRLATVESIAQLIGEVLELWGQTVATGVSGGLIGTIVGGSTGAVVFGIGAAQKLMQRAAYYGKYLSDWINTFINNGPRLNFAYYYSSIGQYTSMFSVTDYNTYVSDSVRGLSVSKMLGPGIIPMNDPSMESMYYVNNVFREKSMFLSLGSENFRTNYPTNIRSYDSSRVDDMCVSVPESSAVSVYEKTKQLSYVASPYMRIKSYKPNQYGDIEDISWVSIGGNCSIDGYYKVYFGGDTFISKFAMKRKAPVFYNNCYNMGDMVPFPYDDYRNIAFPRFFVNFETGMTEDEYTDTESFRNATSAGLGSEYFYPYRISYYNLNGRRNVDKKYLDGRFYLWFYGIPEFYVESDINCNFRLKGVTPEEQFYPDTSDFVWWTQEKNVSIERDNDYKISPIYHARQTISPNVLPATYEKKFYDCAYQRPNGVIWSRQDVSENSQTDPWLVYRPMDYYEFPSRNGDLVHIKRIESNQLLVRFTDQVSLHNAIDVIKERTAGQQGIQSEMGTGGLFASRPLEYNTTDLGYSGTQSTEIVSSEYGHFWVDAKRGAVFMTDPNGRNLQEISSGVRAWLKKHLPFKILKYGITKRGTPEEISYEDVDNKFVSIGLSLGWDNRYKRFLLTKLDYVPAQNPAYYTFEEGKFYYNGSEVSVHDESYFTNASFTIAYSCLTGSWVSYYSFIPEYYIDQQDGFMSALNKDEHTIWSHLMMNKAFQTFYGTNYPFILEVPVVEKYNGTILASVEYELDARKYSDDVNYTHDRKVGLDSVVIYNDTDNSGELRLVPAEKNNMLQRVSYPKVGNGYTEILDTEVYQRHKINDFFNRIDDNRSEVSPWIKDVNEIRQEINPDALNYRTRWKDRLRGSWFLMRVKKAIEDRRIIFRWIIDEFKIKNR